MFRFSAIFHGGLARLRRSQGGWTAFIYFIVTLVLSVALSPKAPKPKAAALDDFDIPVAEEDIPIPVLFGTKRITGSNVVWYGDLHTEKIKKSGLTGSTTVGYKYFLGMHLAFGHGEFDNITKLEMGDKEAWVGTVTTNSTIVVNKPNLFGGKEREGGAVGAIDVLFGGADQPVNAYLDEKQGANCPAYRGVTSLVWKSGYVGNTPYVKAWALTAKRILKGWTGDAPWYPEAAAIGNAMNPAHIIYQCLTDQEWGQGSPADSIDTNSFQEAADQFVEEGFGLNLLWARQTTIEQFIGIVLDHVGGLLAFNQSTGRYMLKLIRGDYDADMLQTFGPESISEVSNFERRSWGETVNELAITYTDRETGQPTAIVVQDLGNIRSQGQRISEKLDFSGIDDDDLMRVVAGRELAARSTPLAKFDFRCNRRLWQYGPGDVLKIQWPAYELPATVFRILNMGRGTLADGKMTVSVIEDIYSLGGIEYTSSQPAPPPVVPPVDTEEPDGGSSVKGNTYSTAPSSPGDGDRYYIPVGSPATGEWSGHEGDLAEWDAAGSQWLFTPVPGGTIFFNEEDQQFFSVDEYGGIGPAPWTPAIHSLDAYPGSTLDPLDVELVGWSIEDNKYYKFPPDLMGGGGGGGGGSDDQTAAEVPYTPFSGLVATNVQDAIDEVAGMLGGGGGSDDQNASEVPFTPAAGIGSTNVQAAIEEAAADITAVSDGLVAVIASIGATDGIAQLDSDGRLPIAQQSMVQIVTDTTTARNLQAADYLKRVRFTNAGSIVYTIQTNASLAVPLGMVVGVRQAGTGQVTVTPSGGVTLNIPSGLIAATRAQGSALQLHKVGTDEWDIEGDLATS